MDVTTVVVDVAGDVVVAGVVGVVGVGGVGGVVDGGVGGVEGVEDRRMKDRKQNPHAQKKLHVASEALALAVVAPVTAYIAHANPELPRWQRGFLFATAVGTLLVDGYLLAEWLDGGER
jgi:hypothetical protein